MQPKPKQNVLVRRQQPIIAKIEVLAGKESRMGKISMACMQNKEVNKLSSRFINIKRSR